MLPPECSDLIMEEYMGDTEDPQTLQIQYTEMMGDFMFVVPALQVAHFQREYICNNLRVAVQRYGPWVSTVEQCGCPGLLMSSLVE